MIRRIKWKNHKVLGYLDLDFTKNDNGEIYKFKFMYLQLLVKTSM